MNTYYIYTVGKHCRGCYIRIAKNSKEALKGFSNVYSIKLIKRGKV